MQKRPIFLPIAWMTPFLLFLGTIFIGCSYQSAGHPPPARDRIVENLAPIVELEQRANRVMLGLQKLAVLGAIGDGEVKNLKEHYDVYYVHHKAAAVLLAEGDIENYHSHVRMAVEELDSMEMKMRTLATFRFN